jgi:Cys-rich repeat protein
VRAAIAALFAAGCVGGVTPVQCAIDADCGAGAFCSAGRCIEGTRTCPTLQPTFSSINASFLQVGCGVRQINCHSADSRSVSSGPSFAGHPYGALVNAPAANRLGSARGLILVKPGDPANSFLLTKLRLTSALDPDFGGGQPANAPGSTCADSLAGR